MTVYELAADWSAQVQYRHVIPRWIGGVFLSSASGDIGADT
ncbi:hypothetical protein [Halobacillus sp. A5]|nr:hypothetical protein [Halobacillus sp. A5]